MNGVSFKIGFTVQPIFVSQKLEQVVKSKKEQLPIINQQCMVNLLSFHLGNVDYVGTLPDIFINARSHTRTQRLANTFWKPMGAYVI